MLLLVSVADPEEAVAAVAGGADIVDAKNPSLGALGPVAPAALGAIVAAVAGRRPVSAAAGELGDAKVVEDPDLEQFGGPREPKARGRFKGLEFVKIGVGEGLEMRRALGLAAGLSDRITRRRESCSNGPASEWRSSPRLVLAAYADAGKRRLSPEAVLDLASRCGAWGVLLDTVDKGGPGGGLFSAMPPHIVGDWVEEAHRRCLMVALAGSLGAADMPQAQALRADVVGVRGAACDGGRRGRVSPSRVSALVAALGGVGPRLSFSVAAAH